VLNFKLDENLSACLVDDLVQWGHAGETCEDEAIGGARDPVVAEHADREARVLATFDLDFSDIRRYPPGTHPGIVVFRLERQDVDNCRAAFHRLLSQVPEDDIRGNLVIVEETTDLPVEQDAYRGRAAVQITCEGPVRRTTCDLAEGS
jgi:predicted nuclease of predicted toxin-antitoxin system